MTARTHDLAAFTALSVVVLSQPARTLTISTAILCVLANLIGGITPDIDQPTAPLWRNLPIGRFFGRLFDDLTGGHRFLTHSILGMSLFGYAAHWLLVWLQPLMPHTNIGLVWWSFMLGLFSHLVMDSFTKEGVPWLLPIPFKFGLPPLKKLRITTGHFAESFIIFPLLLIFNALWLLNHYGALLHLAHTLA